MAITWDSIGRYTRVTCEIIAVYGCLWLVRCVRLIPADQYCSGDSSVYVTVPVPIYPGPSHAAVHLPEAPAQGQLLRNADLNMQFSYVSVYKSVQ